MTKTPWNKGKKWTQSTKKRISQSRRGIEAWNKGKSWPDEVKEKISKARKGKTAWNKGLNWPESVRRKISRAKLAKTLDFKPFYERSKTSKRLRYQTLVRDSFKCRSCGRSANETILEIDHIIPVSKGGKNTLDNLMTLCIDCNRGNADLFIQ